MELKTSNIKRKEDLIYSNDGTLNYEICQIKYKY